MNIVTISCIVIIVIIGIYLLTTTITEMRPSIDPVPKENMSKWQQQITDKLIKGNRSKFEDNLWNNVCPLCGKDMELHTYGSFDQFSDHWCTHCNFITKCRVLC